MEDLLKKFGMKPAVINLKNHDFSKIKMRCSASPSEKDVGLICHMTQTDNNSFTIKIKRKPESSSQPPPKKAKFYDDEFVVAHTYFGKPWLN